MSPRAIGCCVLSLLAAFAPACAPAPETPADPPAIASSQPAALDFAAIGDLLAGRMALQPGERVLLLAAPGRFDELAAAIREHVVTAGGIDLGVASVTEAAPAGWETDFTRSLQGIEGEALVGLLESVELGIMMPGAAATDPVYAALQEVLRGGSGRTIHFHWEGAYSLDGELYPPSPEIDAFYQRALLETDYDELGATQTRFAQALRTGTVRVTTPAGTDITFRAGDRPVTRQDGDASRARADVARNLIDREIELPAGAIRVAPLEETVEGTIAFPPAVWGEERVEGLILTFTAGRVVGVEATNGAAAVEAVLDAAGDTARSFRELAVGFNPALAIPEADPWIPYYGYGAGVVRLSLGDNTELGGDVGGGFVRWNFFTDATVQVDDQIWVRDGRLVDGAE
jgi:hypothetical protein